MKLEDFSLFFNSDVTTMTKRTILDALLETGILSPQKSWPHLASMLVLTFRPEMEMGLAVIAKLAQKHNRICIMQSISIIIQKTMMFHVTFHSLKPHFNLWSRYFGTDTSPSLASLSVISKNFIRVGHIDWGSQFPSWQIGRRPIFKRHRIGLILVKTNQERRSQPRGLFCS